MDYYGIIREAATPGLPAMIVERCYVDNARDSAFCDSEEKLIAFGEADARAVAKYFGLKSSAPDLDYSQEVMELPAVKAEDPDSNLIYYACSLDGGKTFCDKFVWPEGDVLTG